MKIRLKQSLLLLTFFVLITGNVYGQTAYFKSIKEARQKTACPKNSYVLVSWNADNFGRSKSPEIIAFMANLLRDADVVALQEVSVNEAGAQTVAKLADELDRTGSEWEYAISDATGGEGNERYAFLWKKNRVEMTKFKIGLLWIYTDDLTRLPATATFDFDQDRFVIISFHLPPAAKKPELEIKKMEKKLGFDEAQLILVGDFNLPPDKLNPVFEKNLGFKHKIKGKTSLKKTKTKNGYLSRAYDNIFTKNTVDVCLSGIIDFVPAKKTLENARKISDHLPVFIIFKPH